MSSDTGVAKGLPRGDWISINISPSTPFSLGPAVVLGDVGLTSMVEEKIRVTVMFKQRVQKSIRPTGSRILEL